MKTARQRISSHPLVLVSLLIGLIALVACQPIRDPALIAQETASASGTPEPVSVDAVTGVDPAMATVDTPSLRVRALPSEDAEVVGDAKEGDSFPVTGISSDGEWIQVSIEDAPEGLGWISAELVILAGDITSIRVVEVASTEPAEEASADETTEATEEATADATEEANATEEATAQATETEEATEEAIEEATPEATAEATTEATEEATVEATPEATEEAAEEAAEEATVEATVEATDVVTTAATVEPTTTVTAEATPTSGLGSLITTTTVTIVAELPLRVRSEPTTEVDNKIGNVFDGEVYEVLEVSDDGLWVRIAVPELGDGTGWISTEFVVFNEE